MNEFPPLKGQLEAQLVLVDRDLAGVEKIIKEKVLQLGRENDENVKKLIALELLEHRAEKAQLLEEQKTLKNQINNS